MNGVTRKTVLRYAFLPAFKPRLKELFISGFRFIPYFMALVYQAVRLLPDNHPYLNPRNVGQYGIRHVIAAAANNLVVSRGNIDQLILFATILIGIGLVALQIGLLVFSLFAQPVMAAMPTSFEGFFLTPAANAPQDIAYIMLDLVFGVPDMFGSCVDPSAGAICIDFDGEEVVDASGAWILSSMAWPFPIHEAMHQTLQFYSMGLLIVATMITIYFITTIIIETAQTGTAFGKRFNKVWAPVRIVVAFGLLIPVGYGLNSSQYIVLYAAKFGSGFATNGWTLFNQQLGNTTYLGEVENLVSTPKVPEIGGLLQFLFSASVCADLELIKNDRSIDPYLVRDPATTQSSIMIDADGLDYEDMIDFANGASQVILRFGPEPNAVDFPNDPGNVPPTCGELAIPLVDARVPGSDNPPEPGAEIMQRYYWYIVKEIWWDKFYSDDDYGGEGFPLNMAVYYTQWKSDETGGPVTADRLPPPEYGQDLYQFYKDDIKAAMLDPGSTGLDTVIGSKGAIEAQTESGTWALDPFFVERGWAAAGVWYNKVAELNGVVTASVLTTPTIMRYPEIMELVLAKKKQQDQKIQVSTRYEPKLSKSDAVLFTRPEDIQMASAMWQGFNYWEQSGHASTTHTDVTGNAAIDAINGLFGTSGLYSMRENPDVHPLAQLVGVGRSLIEAAVRNLGFSVAAAAGGATLGWVDKIIGQGSVAIIGFFMTVAMIGLTTGFVMFYVVPFMPFIYFFFAVGGWIKAIMEAMVGAPLWALAHIRIDGNGLPGQAAVNGYVLIFEIFLRPILIIFGLLASISVFAALVSVLNQTWEMVSANLGGFDVETEVENGAGATESLADFMRSPIDEFFFTVVYTIVVYTMGMSSFKLIDLIPNNILRWMNQSVSTTNDADQNAAESLAGSAGVGNQQVVQGVGTGMKGSLEQIAKFRLGGG